MSATPVNNKLLSVLPDKDRAQLLSQCELIELHFNEVLYCAGEAVPHVYFPTGGFISLVKPVDDSAGLEVGLVGIEGMLGITLTLGVEEAPFHALVQGAGSSLRIATKIFLRELAKSTSLQLELKRYLYVSLHQLAQTAACTRFHVVEARLARWLLMTQDRADADTFHVTHVFLAYILGVRRVGITKAANSLMKQKLISYRRGNVTILERAGLEAASCSCYRADNEVYRRILGSK
ncbi:MAG: Crp/Fnr family transcriptional regulator [Methylococcales bacterium]